MGMKLIFSICPFISPFHYALCPGRLTCMSCLHELRCPLVLGLIWSMEALAEIRCWEEVKLDSLFP